MNLLVIHLATLAPTVDEIGLLAGRLVALALVAVLAILLLDHYWPEKK